MFNRTGTNGQFSNWNLRAAKRFVNDTRRRELKLGVGCNADADMPFVGRHVMFVETPDKTYNYLNEDAFVNNPSHLVKN